MEPSSRNLSSLKKKSPSTEKSAPLAIAVKRRQQSHSRALRQEFLSALARLETVADAAKELGINRSTCQKWANASGIRRKRQYTQAEKEQFHAALDRTGSIAASARELGLNIGTAHTWAGRINPAARKLRNTRSVKTGPAQRYPPAVIEEFLSVLREIGSVSAAAKQLGLNRSTCSNWAIYAGMSSTCLRRPSEKKTSTCVCAEKELAGGTPPSPLVPANRAPTYGIGNRP